MSRKNNEHQSLKEVLGDFVQDHNLSKGLDKVEVKDLWFELMGKGVGNYTNNVRLQGNTLMVDLSSSVLREELSYGKEKIIAMINEALGKPLIEKIILK